MIDRWDFQFGTPSKHTHVNAKFNLSANLTTTADGENSTPPNERVDARAFAAVRVNGDGIPLDIANAHTFDTVGLSEDAVLSQTINPHTRLSPPTTIPVSLDFEENSALVEWRLIVEAEATVSDSRCDQSPIGPGDRHSRRLSYAHLGRDHQRHQRRYRRADH